jgi:ABC-type antimicrobial peptide transport system permease subunit
MTTMDEVLNKSVAPERMMALLALFFGACALLVTAIGLYGTLAYATARRTSEIGIRMALGARRVGVVAMVFRENVLVAAVGTCGGLIVALLASRALASFFTKLRPKTHPYWCVRLRRSRPLPVQHPFCLPRRSPISPARPNSYCRW